MELLTDKYNKELVICLMEIKNLLKNFQKSDRLKINSWVKVLSVPTNKNLWKKNRNIYILKLLDNMMRGKLEEPFNKFVVDEDKLPVLDDSILLRSKLNKKIKQLVNNNNLNSQIINFIESNYDLFYLKPNNNNIYNIGVQENESGVEGNENEGNSEQNIKNGKSETLMKVRNLSEIFDNNNKINTINYASSPCGQNNNTYFNQNNNEQNDDKIQNQKMTFQNFGEKNIRNQFPKKKNYNNSNKEDLLIEYKDNMQKKVFISDKKEDFEATRKKNEISLEDKEKFKLQAKLIFLENESKIKTRIIEQQNTDLQELNDKVKELEKRIKNLYNDVNNKIN